MSEYLEQHSISRLIGSPPGYIGHDDGGQLTEAVRRRPWSVVLFDEVEKAHPTVWNTLLQLLDEGRLTDGKGRLVDFRQTVVILTSNLAADKLLDDVARHGEITAVGRGAAQAAIRKHFRPEFLNRLDKTVLFAPLGEESLRVILEQSLERATEREGLADRQIKVVLDEEAVRGKKRRPLLRHRFLPMQSDLALCVCFRRWARWSERALILRAWRTHMHPRA
jgi:ATP-dependent Clp protease ATP-binding subunit ClpB